MELGAFNCQTSFLSGILAEMTFRKNVFVSQKITIMAGGREIRVQALLSPYGAKYVFEEGELPDFLKENLDIELVYKNIPAKCRVVKEMISNGTVYSFRFVNPPGLLIRQIEKDVRDNGIPSPWIRSLPRLSATVKNLPVPALAVLSHSSEILFLNVKNFTLGGLLLEYAGPALGEIRFGTRLEFDLVTNSGDKISDLSGLVTHVSREIVKVLDAPSALQIGLRFLPMPPLSEYKYRALIKEHCIGLKEMTEV